MQLPEETIKQIWAIMQQKGPTFLFGATVGGFVTGYALLHMEGGASEYWWHRNVITSIIEDFAHARQSSQAVPPRWTAVESEIRRYWLDRLEAADGARPHVPHEMKALGGAALKVWLRGRSTELLRRSKDPSFLSRPARRTEYWAYHSLPTQTLNLLDIKCLLRPSKQGSMQILLEEDWTTFREQLEQQLGDDVVENQAALASSMRRSETWASEWKDTVGRFVQVRAGIN